MLTCGACYFCIYNESTFVLGGSSQILFAWHVLLYCVLLDSRPSPLNQLLNRLCFLPSLQNWPSGSLGWGIWVHLCRIHSQWLWLWVIVQDNVSITLLYSLIIKLLCICNNSMPHLYSNFHNTSYLLDKFWKQFSE